MTWPLSNYFLIAGIIFLAIAILGNIKFLFLEINPGCFGRSLALILSCVSFLSALILFSLPNSSLDILPTYSTEIIQQSINALNQIVANFQD